MILKRYIIHEICRPLVPVLGTLVALFASYSTADFLSQAVNGLMPSDIIAQMVALKVLIALEVLIPISLYISVVLAFGRLYGDSEFAAMSALRIPPFKLWTIVFTVCSILAVIVGGLSLFARPWAYDRLHMLSAQAESSLDVNAMEAGVFYNSRSGDRAIFLAHRDRDTDAAHGVFVHLRHDDRTEIISAKRAYTMPGTSSAKPSDVYLEDARVYEFTDGTNTADQVLKASKMALDTNTHHSAPPEYNAASASSRQIMASHAPADVAEFQWRLSTPLSTLMLGMMGIPLSRTKPRQSRYSKFGVIVLVYFAYYLLCTSARSWVQHGFVSSFPGIWWVPALLATCLVLALYGPNLHMVQRRRHA